MVERAIVTGPTGVVGVALIEELIGRGVEVVAVCRPGSERKANLPEGGGIRCVDLALSDLGELPGILRSSGLDGADWFFHLGWEATFGAEGRGDVARQLRNVGCALVAVEAASSLGCSVFMGAGSQAECGRVAGALSPDTPANPESGYGAAKLCAGHMTRLRCRQLGIRHEWARVLSVYGPCERQGTFVSMLLRSLLSGEPARLTRCEQVWDFLYARDAARALACIAERGKSGAIYVVGSGESRPLREYALMARDLVDPAGRLDFGAVPYSPGQSMNLTADISALTEDTGFVPEWSFDDGIAETAAWLLSRGAIAYDSGA